MWGSSICGEIIQWSLELNKNNMSDLFDFPNHLKSLSIFVSYLNPWTNPMFKSPQFIFCESINTTWVKPPPTGPLSRKPSVSPTSTSRGWRSWRGPTRCPTWFQSCVGDETMGQLLPHLLEQLEICQKSLTGWARRMGKNTGQWLNEKNSDTQTGKVHTRKVMRTCWDGWARPNQVGREGEGWWRKGEGGREGGRRMMKE